MTHTEYNDICEKILTSTLQYINMQNMRGHMLQKPDTADPVYAGAVADSAPVTLAFTPAGSGKSRLIQDRAKALMASGVMPQEIMVLCMNIAKTRQMAVQMPGTEVMTFNDFVHGLFSTNMPCIRPSDEGSVLASLLLLEQQNPEDKTLVSELIRKLQIQDPEERNILLTLFANQHLDFLTKVLTKIKRSDSTLESMIAMNRIYQFRQDPYEARAILVNGVQNMPLPVLCCVLEYAFMHKCSLFLTGSPSETVYEFSMAYSGAMNVLSAYDGKGLHIIRLLERQRISPDMRSILDQDLSARIAAANVCAEHFIGTNLNNALQKTLVSETGYLRNRLAKKEQVLIVARSKGDIAIAKGLIKEAFGNSVRMADLTAIPAPDAAYGTALARNYENLRKRYGGGITMGCLFMELFEILRTMQDAETNNNQKQKITARKDSLLPWSQAHMQRFNGYDARVPLLDAINCVIDMESEDIQEHFRKMREDPDVDTENADIILSTIHAAIDLRADHCIIIARDMCSDWDDNLYRVALSRARQTEQIIFVNKKPTMHGYQKYLKTHLY